ncbi:MAG: hypothetical protein ABIB61_04120 [Candidatus Shapirobacteria bacterium]
MTGKEQKIISHLAQEKITQKYGEGFFAVYKKAGRVAGFGKNIKELWQVLAKKNVDLKKVVIARFPAGHWRYQS